MHTEPAAPWRHARHFYNRISRSYDLLADASEHAARERGLRGLAVQPGEHVIEVGFGTGHALEALAAAVGPGGRVFGVDVSDGMIDLARERLARARIEPRVRLALADVRCLPCPDATFDAAFMSFTLELIAPSEIGAVLAELSRVLAPGGRLGVVSLSAREHPNPITRVYQWLHRHFPHFIDCQPIDVRGVLEQSGFRLSESADLSIWGLPVFVGIGWK